MTDTEKMIWAATYGAHFAKYGRAGNAAVHAEYAVSGYRDIVCDLWKGESLGLPSADVMLRAMASGTE